MFLYLEHYKLFLSIHLKQRFKFYPFYKLAINDSFHLFFTKEKSNEIIFFKVGQNFNFHHIY